MRPSEDSRNLFCNAIRESLSSLATTGARYICIYAATYAQTCSATGFFFFFYEIHLKAAAKLYKPQNNIHVVALGRKMFLDERHERLKNMPLKMLDGRASAEAELSAVEERVVSSHRRRRSSCQKRKCCHGSMCGRNGSQDCQKRKKEKKQQGKGSPKQNPRFQLIQHKRHKGLCRKKDRTQTKKDGGCLNKREER